jgi:hypothetical protein
MTTTSENDVRYHLPWASENAGSRTPNVGADSSAHVGAVRDDTERQFGRGLSRVALSGCVGRGRLHTAHLGVTVDSIAMLVGVSSGSARPSAHGELEPISSTRRADASWTSQSTLGDFICCRHAHIVVERRRVREPRVRSGPATSHTTGSRQGRSRGSWPGWCKTTRRSEPVKASATGQVTLGCSEVFGAF